MWRYLCLLLTLQMGVCYEKLFGCSLLLTPRTVACDAVLSNYQLLMWTSLHVARQVGLVACYLLWRLRLDASYLS